MNDKAQNQQLSDVVAPLLSEPVPIFLREEAGVRSHGQKAIISALSSTMANLYKVPSLLKNNF